MATTSGWRELDTGVLVRRHESYDLNVGLVVGDERCLVIDTRETLDAGRDLARAVRAVTDLPWAVALTHAHHDHFLGTAAFEPAEVWALDRCADVIARYGEVQRRLTAKYARDAGRTEFADAMDASPVVLPDRTFAPPSRRLELGGRTVTLHHLGRGHTDNDVVLTIGDSPVVFAGDLVEQGGPPQFGDGFPLDWAATLDALLALGGDVVVPGHGDVVDAAFTREQRDLHLGVVAAASGDAATVPGLPDEVAEVALARARAQLAGTLADPTPEQVRAVLAAAGLE